MIVRVGRNATDLAQDPVVGQRLRPVRIDRELGLAGARRRKWQGEQYRRKKDMESHDGSPVEFIGSRMSGSYVLVRS
jgi:hypothetical protein